MAAPRVGEQLEVQDPLEGPEQDSGQVALGGRDKEGVVCKCSHSRTYLPPVLWILNNLVRIRILPFKLVN
jgi:hypothetical protein